MVVVTHPLSLILAALLVNFVQAAPWPTHSKHSTHRVRLIGKRQLKLESYHPEVKYKTYGTDGGRVPSTGNSSLKEKAFAYVSSMGVDASNLNWQSGFTAGSSQYAYVKQSLNGIPVANSLANVAFNGDQVVSYGTNFIDASSAKAADPNPTVSWRSVLPQVEDALEGKYNGQNATLEYLVQSDGSLALTHVIQLQNNKTSAFYEAYIDAHTGKLVSVTDFVAHASYTVLPITKQAFTDGIETLVDPEDLESSPFGWHSDGQENSTTTSGNNVLAFKGQQAAAETSEGLNFNAEYNDNLDPVNAANLNAARTNAFYILNTMHDFSYRYGFTESAFNFQFDNFGKGGADQDNVMVSVQDASGLNNANFATPPDGQNGVCRMFIWDQTSPNRDGTMENDIVIHEMTHGITNRLTGGGSARCLQSLESGGLGEGWGDAMADWMHQKSAQTTDYVLGAYVTNSAQGLRSFPYSTDPKVNPLTFADVRQRNDVHNIGEVWANMLHNVYDALVQARGFSSEKLTNPDGKEGNIVFMRLFMTSLSLQPCNPTFVSARDAWIQADQNLFNGANRCTLFNAFASRGLGLNAGKNFVNDPTVPAGC